METMVSRILDSVRLERGRVDLKSEPVELARRGRLASSPSSRSARARNASPSTADMPRAAGARRSAGRGCSGAQPAGKCARGGRAGRRRHDRAQLRARVEARSRALGARQRRGFSRRRWRAAVREVLTPAPRRRQQLLRHGARPLHRPAADAARRRPGQRAQRGCRAGRAIRHWRGPSRRRSRRETPAHNVHTRSSSWRTIRIWPRASSRICAPKATSVSAATDGRRPSIGSSENLRAHRARCDAPGSDGFAVCRTLRERATTRRCCFSPRAAIRRIGCADLRRRRRLPREAVSSAGVSAARARDPAALGVVSQCLRNRRERGVALRRQRSRFPRVSCALVERRACRSSPKRKR